MLFDLLFCGCIGIGVVGGLVFFVVCLLGCCGGCIGGYGDVVGVVE